MTIKIWKGQTASRKSIEVETTTPTPLFPMQSNICINHRNLSYISVKKEY